MTTASRRMFADVILWNDQFVEVLRRPGMPLWSRAAVRDLVLCNQRLKAAWADAEKWTCDVLESAGHTMLDALEIGESPLRHLAGELRRFLVLDRADHWDRPLLEELARLLEESASTALAVEALEYVSSSQAANYLGCTERHVRRLAKRGAIKGRIGPDGSWRCSTTSIRDYRRRS